VLSRQLGLYVDAKEKVTTDLLWGVADELVKHVAEKRGFKRNAIPGQWNQALMELGATICTPKPNCGNCPIRKTCKAYAEGELFLHGSLTKGNTPDIEDACTYCKPLATEDLEAITEGEARREAENTTKKRKCTKKISSYFTIPTPKPAAGGRGDRETSSQLKRKAEWITETSKPITSYCSLFPKKNEKKDMPREDYAVCIIELRPSSSTESYYLIEQRPEKGMCTCTTRWYSC
jgi:A/G-specific adenine glycosylase